MKCACCNTEVPAGMKFCLCCGTRVPEEERREAERPSETAVMPEAEHAAQEAPAAPAFPGISFSWELDADDQPVVRLQNAWQTQKKEETPAPPEAPSREEADRELLRTVPNLWLPTGRGWGKMLLLGIVTLGIYPAVIWSRMATELNIAVSRHDGKRTMPWFAMAALSVVTLSVFSFVWNHRFCRRVGAELRRRNLDWQLRPRDFWLWNVLGAFILVGPVIYVHKVTKAMNLINADYNSCG